VTTRARVVNRAAVALGFKFRLNFIFEDAVVVVSIYYMMIIANSVELFCLRARGLREDFC
jgi:hypothetical protein